LSRSRRRSRTDVGLLAQQDVCEERLIRAYREEAFPAPSSAVAHLRKLHRAARDQQLAEELHGGRSHEEGPAAHRPGDGLTLWTITHNSDFAKGLVGSWAPRIDRHAFHITSDEALTWDQSTA